MNVDQRIYVAGHTGMVGSAVVRALRASGYENLLLASRSEADLTSSTDVGRLFESNKIDHVIVAAARVGGILANDTYPADFLRENLLIECNLIDRSCQHGVESLLFLGSSCIYPKFAEQPIHESALLQGPLEPTNEAYALAKISGIKLCESYNRQFGTDFRSLMPTNLYGPNDNFDEKSSHVVPALIRRFHDAKEKPQNEVEVWGSGTPRREFLHVDDLADAILKVLLIPRENFWSKISARQSHINVGTGVDVEIAELAKIIAEVVGFDGEIRFDSSKPDGTPRKLLDVSVIRSLGWNSRIDLKEGLASTYQWYLENNKQLSLEP